MSHGLLIDLDTGLESGPLQVPEVGTGRTLQFQVTLLRGGFFGELRGEVSSGDWPQYFVIDDRVLEAQREKGPYLHLPREEVDAGAIGALGLWLSGRCPPPASLSAVKLFPAASEVAIDSLQRTVESKLPSQYHELIQLTDGLDIGSLEILGTRDAYVFDHGRNERHLVISSLGDGGVITVPTRGPRCGEVVLISLAARDASGTTLARDLKAFIAQALEARRSASS